MKEIVQKDGSGIKNVLRDRSGRARGKSRIFSPVALLIAILFFSALAIVGSLYFFPQITVLVLVVLIVAIRSFVKRRHLDFFDDNYSYDRENDNHDMDKQNVPTSEKMAERESTPKPDKDFIL